MLQKEQTKYLGVTIDAKLNWKPHVHNCTSKLNKCLWPITKLRPYTSIPTLKLLYYSLAYPFIQYCISSWGGACQTTLQPLLIKQKIIIKTILSIPKVHITFLSSVSKTWSIKTSWNPYLPNCKADVQSN